MKNLALNRHILIEKELDEKFIIDKYAIGQGGCFWTVSAKDCLIRKWSLYSIRNKGRYNDELKFKSENIKAYLIANKLTLREVINQDAYLYFLGQNSYCFSLFKSAHRYLVEHAIPNEIIILEKRLSKKNMKASRRERNNIKLKSFIKRHKKLMNNFNNNA